MKIQLVFVSAVAFARQSSSFTAPLAFSESPALSSWRNERRKRLADQRVCRMIWRSNPETAESRRKSRQDEGKRNDSKRSSPESKLGGVAQVIRSVEGFKRSQHVGQTTDAFLRERASVLIEGSSAEGQVKVCLDGQQRPCVIEVEPVFAEQASKSGQLNDAIEEASAAAHQLALQELKSRLSSLNSKLNFPGVETSERAPTQLDQTADGIVKELETVMAEGTSSDGKIRITMDGYQCVRDVVVEESIVAFLKPHELHMEILEAMDEAYEKSKKLAAAKINRLFADLDFPSTRP